ncbi:hypothetical protein SLEP1_g25636 [Rubroshorea leprosula]|uniref:SWIM-type domain-containing protein n=1 Tax=Rubroshorea leprosula TaxID=152421 RepID=A0AAV5JTD1_9ROSI|nr:hypothetical protein SLEP1_g25636 [Rubroshorea leprosula]
MEVDVSIYKCQRAKKIIKDELHGSYIEQYKLLRGYGEHMLSTNPGSTCVIGTQNCPDVMYQFKRIYMCFDGCKKGWKAGCRPIIGVDGSFLKGPCKGILFSAIRRDGNNQMFPLAWAVVDTENKDNWQWFMELLNIDIEFGEGMGLTIISDMHQGIISAREVVFPYAKHRYCARHVYANWAKIWRGEEFKIRFWAIAQASWPKEYEHQMMLLKKLFEAAWTDLQRYDPKKWCRAFFDEEPYCDMVDNNMCESFNFWVMEARYLAIISMVDTLRSQVMERIGEKYAFIPKWKGDIALRARKKLEANKKESSSWKLVWDGRTGFEVKHVWLENSNRHVVDLMKRTCACRTWQMNGIPCPHAVCCMYHENLVPKDFVADWYKKEKYALAYGFPIKGMCGDKSWQKFHGEPLNPPPIQNDINFLDSEYCP